MISIKHCYVGCQYFEYHHQKALTNNSIEFSISRPDDGFFTGFGFSSISHRKFQKPNDIHDGCFKMKNCTRAEPISGGEKGVI